MEDEPKSKVIDRTLDVAAYFAVGLEVLAVTVIVIGVLYATHIFLSRDKRTGRTTFGFREYRLGLGRTLLLGLEILVAADIVRTVAIDPSVESVGILGMLVLIRTFLSWSLQVEIERRWPWQPRQESDNI